VSFSPSYTSVQDSTRRFNSPPASPSHCNKPAASYSSSNHPLSCHHLTGHHSVQIYRRYRFISPPPAPAIVKTPAASFFFLLQSSSILAPSCLTTTYRPFVRLFAILERQISRYFTSLVEIRTNVFMALYWHRDDSIGHFTC